MTVPASTICCPACGHVTDPADPYPFRCLRAGTDDADHVLTRVLNLTNAGFPEGDEANPFLRYRALMHSYHVATSRAPADQPYRDPQADQERGRGHEREQQAGHVAAEVLAICPAEHEQPERKPAEPGGCY